MNPQNQEKCFTLPAGAWYGDGEITIRIPDDWMVEVRSPKPVPPLSPADISARLRSPIAQPPIRELARGAQNPVMIVDDLNRPTPASLIMPALLSEFEAAGITPESVRIVMGPGTIH